MNQHFLDPLLIATGNAHKVREIGQILQALPGWRIFKLLERGGFSRASSLPKRTGETFEANALLKARAYAPATGLLTLADDSGLVVEALSGRPGVYSARYAETSALANARLLAELHGVPPERRGARFECVVALADPRGGCVTRRGVLTGRVAETPRGEGGFGYDPIFELPRAPTPGGPWPSSTRRRRTAQPPRARAWRQSRVPRPSLPAGRVTETINDSRGTRPACARARKIPGVSAVSPGALIL